ncbi:MAG: hypothetical protein AMJ91_01775 [candidate division Zixibacteria bacterium SM23_73_3]|nr:MAG: hypothetical protein AMJ91_01775 [candidate division Zixibacteria bacterium SM23_73_3]
MKNLYYFLIDKARRRIILQVEGDQNKLLEPQKGSGVLTNLFVPFFNPEPLKTDGGRDVLEDFL